MCSWWTYLYSQNSLLPSKLPRYSSIGPFLICTNHSTKLAEKQFLQVRIRMDFTETIKGPTQIATGQLNREEDLNAKLVIIIIKKAMPMNLDKEYLKTST